MSIRSRRPCQETLPKREKFLVRMVLKTHRFDDVSRVKCRTDNIYIHIYTRAIRPARLTRRMMLLHVCHFARESVGPEIRYYVRKLFCVSPSILFYTIVVFFFFFLQMTREETLMVVGF